MFDKLYKEANDEIPINTALKEELIRKASAKSIKSVSKKTVMIRRCGFAATAAAVIALSFTAMPYIKDNFSADSSYISVGPNQNDGAAEEPTENAAPHTEPPKTAAENSAAQPHPDGEKASGTSVAASKNSTAAVQKSTSDNSAAVPNTPKTAAESETNQQEKQSAAKAENVPAPQAEEAHSTESYAEESTESTDQSEVPSAEKRSGGGSSAYAAKSMASAENSADNSTDCGAVMAMSADLQTSLTLSEYCDYYGFDLSGIKLPRGMALTDGNTAELGTDHTVVYSGNGKSISVKLILDSASVSVKAKSGSAENYNGTLMEETDNTHYTVYLTDKNIVVKTNGLSKNEVHTLTDSLK